MLQTAFWTLLSLDSLSEEPGKVTNKNCWNQCSCDKGIWIFLGVVGHQHWIFLLGLGKTD